MSSAAKEPDRHLTTYSYPTPEARPVPLQLRSQVARVEGCVDDARLGRGPGALARQEDVPDLGLPVVELHALVLGAAVLVQDHPLWPRAGDMHGDRGGPRDADGCCRGGGSRLCQEGEKQLVEQEVAETVCADVQLVPLGVDAALGWMHYLRATRPCQRDRIHPSAPRALCLWA